MYICITVYMYNCTVRFFANMAEHIYMHGVKLSKYGRKLRIFFEIGRSVCSNSFLDLNVFLNNAALENVQRINAMKQWAVAAIACLYCEDNKILTTNHFFLQFPWIILKFFASFARRLCFN